MFIIIGGHKIVDHRLRHATDNVNDFKNKQHKVEHKPRMHLPILNWLEYKRWSGSKDQ